MAESSSERVETVIQRKARRDWVTGLLILALVASMAWIVVDNQRSSHHAAVAASNAQTLAEQVQAACLAGDVIIGSRSICVRADAVADQPTASIQGTRGLPGDSGPQGFTGQQGVDGKSGPAGIDGTAGLKGADGMPGPKGSDGDAGLSGNTGPPGAVGSPGPVGLPGPVGPVGPSGTPGADGLNGTDGAPGIPGAPGPAGRGITSVACVDQGSRSTPVWNWVFTFTDSTTLDVPGPCRVTTTP